MKLAKYVTKKLKRMAISMFCLILGNSRNFVNFQRKHIRGSNGEKFERMIQLLKFIFK